MKRFLLIFGIFLLGGLFVFASFLSHFNPDRYRPQVKAYLENQLRQTVDLGPLSVTWNGLHPAVTAQGIILKNAETQQVLLQSKKVRAGIFLPGILLRQIVIERLILEEAHFSFLHQEDGSWNWDFLKSKKTKFIFFPLAGWKIRIDKFEAPRTSVYYADKSELPYFHYEWHSLNIRFSPLDSGVCRIQIFPESQQGLTRMLELKLITPQQLLVLGDFGPFGSAKGEIQNPFQEGRFSLRGALQNVDLKALSLADVEEGRGGLKMEAFGEGVHPESLKRTLIVKGETSIHDGQIFPRNMVMELLKSISPLPGFSNLTRQPFKEKFESFSQKSGTVFKDLKADYRLSSGRFFAENFELESPDYRIEADGNLNLMENRVEIKGICYVKGELAAHLISRVRDMDVLTNTRQELEIPFSYKGSGGNFKPSADLFYIANRLIQIRGEQLASRGIQKINEFLKGVHP